MLRYTVLSLFVANTALAQTSRFDIRSDSLIMFGRTVAVHGGYAVSNQDSLGSTDLVVFKQEGFSWVAVAELKGDADATSTVPSDPPFSSAMDGDRLIWGAPEFDYPTRANGGIAYVYKRDGETWLREGTLSPSDVTNAGDFGLSVDIEGGLAIVGSPDFEDTSGMQDEGAAYVYAFDGTQWVEEARLLPDDREAGRKFGWSVGISGNYAVVGVLIDNEGAAAAGAAYVFERTGTTWSQMAKLIPSDPTAGGTFGISVSIDDQFAVVGAQGATGNAIASGAAYVFSLGPSGWTEFVKLSGSDSTPGDFFGRAVSNDQECVAVGAFLAGGGAGAAYVFSYKDISWVEQIKLTDDDPLVTPSQFGSSVSISADVLAVGAPVTDDDGDFVYTGSVSIYEGVCNIKDTAVEPSVGAEGTAHLLPNHPNPFDETTTVSFTLQRHGRVSVKVFDVLGREVATLMEREAAPGDYEIPFDRGNLQSGVYFLNLEVNGRKFVREMTLLVR